MRLIRAIDAFYPLFPIGGEPAAVPCQLREVEANGRRFVKTPFNMLDADDAADNLERMIGAGFHATEADCLAFLAGQYPNWQAAAPLAEALNRSTAIRGQMMGGAHVERITGLSTLNGELHRAARGARDIPLKRIRAAVAALTAYAKSTRP